MLHKYEKRINEGEAIQITPTSNDLLVGLHRKGASRNESLVWFVFRQSNCSIFRTAIKDLGHEMGGIAITDKCAHQWYGNVISAIGQLIEVLDLWVVRCSPNLEETLCHARNVRIQETKILLHTGL